MKINNGYHPDPEESEPCFGWVKDQKQWYVIDLEDGYLICTCYSRANASMVTEAMNLHWGPG